MVPPRAPSFPDATQQPASGLPTGNAGLRPQPVAPKHCRKDRRDHTSRGTTSALASGIRDQGATSTTLPTAPPPALART